MIVEGRQTVMNNLGYDVAVKMVLSPRKVRELCVNRKLYTAGTNEEYDRMLNLCYEEDTEPSMIAADIWGHTSVEQREYFNREGYTLASLLFDIWNECMEVRVALYQEVK